MLEVHMDQPVPGHYYWMVVDLGQTGESHRVLGYAAGPLATREAARAEGLRALNRCLQGRAVRTDSVVLH